MAILAVGERLRSRVSHVDVIVVRAPAVDLTLTCDGTPLAREGDEVGDRSGATTEHETTLGKRYEDDDAGIEVLCVAPGPGRLEVDGRPLTLKAAKALPSSD